MNAFGRDIVSRTFAGVLATIIVGILAAIWTSPMWRAPLLSRYYSLSSDDLRTWGLGATVVVVVVVAIVLTRLVRNRTSLTLKVNSGAKPAITMTHHGRPTTYRIDGQILSLNDGTPNPWPNPFQCQIQKGGITGGWEMLLRDGEWANVILGTVEPAAATSSRHVLVVQHLDHLFIRRGALRQHVPVSDAGAVVELTFTAQPPLAHPIGSKRFNVVRQGRLATVEEIR